MTLTWTGQPTGGDLVRIGFEDLPDNRPFWRRLVARFFWETSAVTYTVRYGESTESCALHVAQKINRLFLSRGVRKLACAEGAVVTIR